MKSSEIPNNLNYRHLIWWAIFMVYVCAGFYFSYFWITELPEKYQIKQASIISSAATRPNLLDTGTTEPVTLPDWNSASRLGSTHLWYLIPVKHHPNSPVRQAIYLPKVSQNVEVFLNGKWLGNGGNMEQPITRNRNNTLLFNFDSSLMRENNTVAIHLVGQHISRTYLGNVYIGPLKPLRNHAELNNYLRIDLSTTITLCLLLTSILISILWVLRQPDTYYLYYGIFSALWAFHEANHFIQNIPISLNLWETLSPLSFGLAMLGVIVFLHRYVGTFNKKYENIVITGVILFALPFCYQDLDWIIYYAYHIWSPAIALFGTYSLYFLYDSYKKTGEGKLILLSISGCSIMIFGLHDLLLAIEVIPKHSPYMMHFAVLFTVITIIGTLIQRFVQSINVVAHYNQELEQEIRLKTDDIEQSYQQVQQLMRKYTVAEERQRLMRDIHDGIGGQLVATLASMDAGTVSQDLLKSNLKAALQDLRMVIDSLDYEAEDLPTLLGMLRMRLSGQLSNANLTLHWQVEDLPRIDNFGPANVLNTMRIIQEAITNAIKHSDAKNLTISTSMIIGDDEQQYACIEVSDDGRGINPDSKAKGRGLLNMQKRADLVGAKLAMINSQGTKITLRIPINVQPNTL